MSIRLRARVAFVFAMLSLLVAGSVSASTYTVASWYLLGQRESAALTRAALDSRAVSAYLVAGLSPSDALNQVPSVGTSQPMITIDGTWYTTSITISPDALPQLLLEASRDGGASQRFAIAGDPFYAVAIPIPQGTYVEVFPLRDLDAILTWGGWVLLTLTAGAALVGALIGRTAAGRVLGPIRRLGAGARRIASGEFDTRIDLTGDPDLDPIAGSFNDMAEAVQARIAREQRFSANVSHELRSPMTSVLGTAELLERRRAEFPHRDAELVTVLADQVRRLARMLVDLLDISRLNAQEPLQLEMSDIASLCRDVARRNGLDPSLVIGDEPFMRTDPRRFDRIIGNLVSNAQVHGGGATLIQIRREPESVVVIVDDAGPGVDAGVRGRIFEPFVHGAGAQSGAGLGLAIALEQARMLGAELSIVEAPSGGARGIVVLPWMVEP